MNILVVLIVSILFVGGLDNKPKDSQEEKKITQVTVNTVLEAKALKEEEFKVEPQEQEPAQEVVKIEPQEQEPAQEVVKVEPQEQEPAQEVVKIEPQEQEPAQEEDKDLKTDKELRSEVKELDKSTDSEINYLSLALYIFGFILVISVGVYIYFRQRNSSPLSSATDNTRREFKEEVKSEPQEQPAEEEVKSEPQEQEPAQEVVKVEPQEQPAEEEVKDLKTDEELDEDEKK